ncbi:MAG: DUF411 domain-containing protein [Pseudohongiellaceae bacterium]
MPTQLLSVLDIAFRLFSRSGRTLALSGALLVSAVLTACSGESAGNAQNSTAGAMANNGDMPQLEVYLTRTCGCCGGWVEHSQAEGFDSLRNYVDQDQLNQEKADRGIAPRLQSCHTAVSEEGYVFEGHIPARVIHDFLESPPDNAIGLAVPGMPIGSPGMEMGDRFDPYDVLLIHDDGSTEVYTHIASADQQ